MVIEMKITRVIALSLALIISAFAFVSCGEKAPEAPEINVTVQIRTGETDDTMILNSPVKVQAENPTVIDALVAASIQYDIDYNLSDDGKSIKDILTYREEMVDDTIYYWFYEINGKEPTSGTASTNFIADGDTITYKYVSMSK